MGRALLVLALASCGSSVAPAPEAEAPEELERPETRPDVVLILIDTLRRDHLSIYGHEDGDTPWLEALARRSAVFDQARSTSSWTSPSTASLFTGLYPERHGVHTGYLATVDVLRESRGEVVLRSLPEQLATLPELMQAAGYRTLGISSNLNVSSERGFARGFERFETRRKTSAEGLAQVLAGWGAEAGDSRPTFWYLHFNDVHSPYDPRPPWYEESGRRLADKRAAYDSEIAWIDRRLEQLEAALGWGEDTVLVLLSDHGEEFREHGNLGHAGQLYDELMRIPFLVRVPWLPRLHGARVEVGVSLIDVLPTLVELLDLPARDGAIRRDGRSLVPVLRGAGVEPRPLFGHRLDQRNGRVLRAVVEGTWKLITYEAEGEADGREELYDLVRDPGEQRDVLEAHPEPAARLRRLLAEHAARRTLEGEDRRVDLDPELQEHLLELGYVGGDE